MSRVRRRWGPAGWVRFGLQSGGRLIWSPARAVGQAIIVGEEVQVKVSGVLEPVLRGMVSNIVEPDETLFMSYDQAIRAKSLDIAPKTRRSS